MNDPQNISVAPALQDADGGQGPSPERRRLCRRKTPRRTAQP